jgi:flagellar biosynthesis component FlhA
MAFKKGQSGNPIGRAKGSKNKLNEELREAIGEFLTGEFKNIKGALKQMDFRDRMKFFIDVLPYALPRLQNTSLEVDFAKLPDDQLDEIIESLKNEAVKQQANGIEFES